MSNVIVVTGSRSWRDIRRMQLSFDALQYEFPEADFTLRQGCASGADAIARSIASFYHWDIEDYWPDYMSYSFAEANKLRNIAMLEDHPRPIRVLAYPTKQSRGTWHCANEAKRRGIKVDVHED